MDQIAYCLSQRTKATLTKSEVMEMLGYWKVEVINELGFVCEHEEEEEAED